MSTAFSVKDRSPDQSVPAATSTTRKALAAPLGGPSGEDRRAADGARRSEGSFSEVFTAAVKRSSVRQKASDSKGSRPAEETGKKGLAARPARAAPKARRGEKAAKEVDVPSNRRGPERARSRDVSKESDRPDETKGESGEDAKDLPETDGKSAEDRRGTEQPGGVRAHGKAHPEVDGKEGAGDPAGGSLEAQSSSAPIGSPEVDGEAGSPEIPPEGEDEPEQGVPPDMGEAVAAPPIAGEETDAGASSLAAGGGPAGASKGGEEAEANPAPPSLEVPAPVSDPAPAGSAMEEAGGAPDPAAVDRPWDPIDPSQENGRKGDLLQAGKGERAAAVETQLPTAPPGDDGGSEGSTVQSAGSHARPPSLGQGWPSATVKAAGPSAQGTLPAAAPAAQDSRLKEALLRIPEALEVKAAVLEAPSSPGPSGTDPGAKGSAPISVQEARPAVQTDPPADPRRPTVLDLSEGQDRWTGRLAMALRSQIRSGGSQLRMVLKPPRLGQLELKLVLRGPVLRLSIDVESNSARHILSAGTGELRENLKEAGLQLERIQITVNERERRSGGDEGRQDQDEGGKRKDRGGAVEGLDSPAPVGAAVSGTGEEASLPVQGINYQA